MKYIIRGQAFSTPIHYYCVVDKYEGLTQMRDMAFEYDDLLTVVATVAIFNRDKPFRRPDLTYSWEIAVDDDDYTSESGYMMVEGPEVDELKSQKGNRHLAFIVAICLTMTWLLIWMIMTTPTPPLR